MVSAVLATDPHAAARDAARRVTDPELPMLTLADLGVLRDVRVTGTRVVATVTPTYSGCPAMATMRADLDAALRSAGFSDVRVQTVLSPPWTSDWISDCGREKLAAAGISPPGTAPAATNGPVPLTLLGARRRSAVTCPACGSTDTELSSTFSATACRALWRCRNCREPFEHFKEH